LKRILTKKYEARLDEIIKPIMSHIGMTVLKEVKAKAPDFDNYAAGVHRRMAANPHLSVEDAYKLESYDDRIKAGGKNGR
jgi:hypothetical protein